MNNIWKLIKKILTFVMSLIVLVLATLAALLHFSVEWMFETWNNLTIDELLFHLNAPMDGTNEGMIVEYMNLCLVPAVLIFITVIILLIGIHGKKRWIIWGIGLLLSIACIFSSCYETWERLEIGDYAEAQGQTSDFISDYYVDPETVEITFPEEKKNLIYIFLESMEVTYADTENGGAFEQSVIPELTVIAQENEDFSGANSCLNGAYSLEGSTWTMGAMFAHTSALPLKISIGANDMNTQDSFFSSIVTLGDILQNEGYSQTLLIGSDAVFGGRELYFTEHGDYEMMDYGYAWENHLIPEDYRVFWGYEDKRLFGFAKDKLLELSENDQPFNLTILTVDTHFEDGYVCESCPSEFEGQYENVMKCSSQQIDEFIKWIQNQDFYENTTIVLVGDHSTMDKDFCADIDSDYERRVYTAYINSAVEVSEKAERKYATLDFYPTTLASLGVTIEGNRLGLGTNLFSNVPTLIERFGIEKIESEFEKKSEFMEKLADIDS